MAGRVAPRNIKPGGRDDLFQQLVARYQEVSQVKLEHFGLSTHYQVYYYAKDSDDEELRELARRWQQKIPKLESILSALMI
jgi:hypothetical protein